MPGLFAYRLQATLRWQAQATRATARRPDALPPPTAPPGALARLLPDLPETAPRDRWEKTACLSRRGSQIGSHAEWLSPTGWRRGRRREGPPLTAVGAQRPG